MPFYPNQLHLRTILITVLLLLLSSCVTIPDNHFTVEQNNGLCTVNSACDCAGSVLPESFLNIDSRDRGLNPDRITLLSWNSYKQTSPAWLARLHQLSTGVDLLTLQEGVMSKGLRDQLKEDFPGGWLLANAFSQKDRPTGVLTAAGVQSDFSCSFRIAEPIIIVPKTVLISRYPIAGSNATLLLANLHMVNFSLAFTTYREQLRKTFDLLNQHEGPILIAGDFNSWSRGRQTIMLHFADALGMETVRFPEDTRSRFHGHALDYIFYRGLQQLTASSPPVNESDHNPLLATFRVADPVLTTESHL